MWHRRGAGPLIEADPRWYELLDPVSWPEQAWRDPWVFGAEDGTFHALLTARAATGDAPTRGVVGHAVSHDLVSWQVRPPVTEPGMFGHLEIPQVVWIADRWWLLFSTSAATAPDAPAAARTAGTHALNSTRGPTGPFDWSTHQLLDGDALRSWYGGRIVTDLAGRPQFLAWRQHDDRGCFVGEIGDPVPVGVEAGRLVVRR
jgi:beta-fructofuranosidase